MNDNKLEAELLGALTDRHVLTTHRSRSWDSYYGAYYRLTEHTCSKCGGVFDYDMRIVKREKCPGSKDQTEYDEDDEEEV